MLNQLWSKGKAAIGSAVAEELNRQSTFLIAAIFLIGALGFGLGRLSAVVERRTPLTIETIAEKTPPAKSATKEDGGSPTATGRVVASKNGTKYHFPNCPGAKQIKTENQIWFDSPSDAERAGYTLAGNCRPP